MKVKTLGSSGGKTPTNALTCFMVDNKMLLDIGGACSALSLKQQKGIDNILISHSHLDHIYSLPFIVDNVARLREKPIKVISIKPVLDIIKNDLLNDVIWPDFSKIKLPNGKPVMQYKSLALGKPTKIDGYLVEAIEVNHSVPAVGFFISDDSGTLLYTGDMGPTKGIWEHVKHLHRGLSAVLTELSFPNSMEQLAIISGHLTPDMLEDGLVAAGSVDIPIYLSHMKPQYKDTLIEELDRVPRKNIHVLKDGTTFTVRSKNSR